MQKFSYSNDLKEKLGYLLYTIYPRILSKCKKKIAELIWSLAVVKNPVNKIKYQIVNKDDPVINLEDPMIDVEHQAFNMEHPVVNVEIRWSIRITQCLLSKI